MVRRWPAMEVRCTPAQFGAIMELDMGMLVARGINGERGPIPAALIEEMAALLERCVAENGGEFDRARACRGDAISLVVIRPEEEFMKDVTNPRAAKAVLAPLVAYYKPGQILGLLAEIYESEARSDEYENYHTRAQVLRGVRDDLERAAQEIDRDHSIPPRD